MVVARDSVAILARALINIIPFDPIPTARSNGIKFVSIFMMAIAAIAVLLRFYCRIYIVKSPGWDDWFSLGALILTFGFDSCLLGLIWMRNPAVPFLTANEMTIATNLLIAAEAFYIWCMVFIKISLGIFFLRLLVERWQRRIVYSMVILSTVTGFAYFWYAVFQCGLPNSGGLTFWEKVISKKCNTTPVKADTAAYIHGSVQVLTDISMLLVPLPVIINAKIIRKEKQIIFAIFFVAVLGCTASIVRLAFVTGLSNQTETFWNGIIILGIWSCIECGMGITATSIATLRPLLRKFTSWISGSVSFRSRSTKSGFSSTRTKTQMSASGQYGIPSMLETRSFDGLERGSSGHGEVAYEKGEPQVNFLETGTTAAEDRMRQVAKETAEKTQKANSRTFWLDNTINSMTARNTNELGMEPNMNRSISESFFDRSNELDNMDSTGQRLGYLGRPLQSRGLASRQSKAKGDAGDTSRSRGWPLLDPRDEPSYQSGRRDGPETQGGRGAEVTELENTIPIQNNRSRGVRWLPVSGSNAGEDNNVYWPNQAILFAHEDLEPVSRSDTTSNEPN